MTTPDAERAQLPATYDGPAGDRQALPWQQVSWEHTHERLERERAYWVVTATPDGSPCARPVWGLWQDDTFVFNVGRGTRTARNTAGNPRVALHLESGNEAVIVEGVAERITDLSTLDESLVQQFIETYAVKYDLAGIQMDALRAFDGVPHIVRPRLILAWKLDSFPQSATRWRFDTGSLSGEETAEAV